MNHSNIFVLTIHPITDVFTWSSEDDFITYAGANAVVDTINWAQGANVIENFNIDLIEIAFYRDRETTDRIFEDDADFMIGDEGLNEIVTLENFVDNIDGTGSVDVRVNPSGITVEELMANLQLYMTLYVFTF